MYKFQSSPTYFALRRLLSLTTYLLWMGGCVLLVCSCTGDVSQSAYNASAAPADTSPGADNIASGQVSLAWDAVSAPDLAGYRLYYGQTSHAYTSQIDVGPQTTYTMTGLTDGQTYYFVVTAYDSAGNESPPSNEISITIGAAVAASSADSARDQESGVSVTASQTNSARGQESGAVAFTAASMGTSNQRAGSHTATQTAQITVASALLEVGDLTVDSTWKRVTFRQTFVDPIVVATPLSSHDFALAIVRIQRVDPTGFEIRIQAWDDHDGIHASESVSYLAMERGAHLLGTGIQVEAGRLTMDEIPTQPFTPISFHQAFSVTPVVLTAVTSVNEADAVMTRVRSITPDSFEVGLQEQMTHEQRHATETIDYIAWQPSVGTVAGFTFEVRTTPEVIGDQVYALKWTEPFVAPPMFLAAMQTANGWEPATLRWDNKDLLGVELQLQAEAPGSYDLDSITEVVGYMAFTY